MQYSGVREFVPDGFEFMIIDLRLGFLDFGLGRSFLGQIVTDSNTPFSTLFHRGLSIQD